MSRPDAPRPDPTRDGLTRRDVLRAGSAAMLGAPALRGLTAQGRATRPLRGDINVILLMLVGGPSQLDTWDPKPDAPEEVRGPFRPIQTRVPGIQVSELFPRLAGIMDRVSLVRSVHSHATAVHDPGHQLMQTGRLFEDGREYPHHGSVMSYLRGSRGDAPAHVLLPKPIGLTGGSMPHGQNAGFLGPEHDPFVLNADPCLLEHADLPHGVEAGAARAAFDLSGEPARLRDRYGRTQFGQSCLMARRLVESGVRFVTVNQFETVFVKTTWDSHGSAPFSSMADYRREVGPDFDAAYTALIEDLDRTGLLATTLVLAAGEFGRTPRINAVGGRDHHTGCWTVLFAGGSVVGGRIVGASDATGHEPRDRPVTPADIAATLYHATGVNPDAALPGPDGTSIPIIEPGATPIHELF